MANPPGARSSPDELDRVAASIRPSWEQDDPPFSNGNRTLNQAEWDAIKASGSIPPAPPLPTGLNGHLSEPPRAMPPASIPPPAQGATSVPPGSFPPPAPTGFDSVPPPAPRARPAQKQAPEHVQRARASLASYTDEFPGQKKSKAGIFVVLGLVAAGIIGFVAFKASSGGGEATPGATSGGATTTSVTSPPPNNTARADIPPPPPPTTPPVETVAPTAAAQAPTPPPEPAHTAAPVPTHASASVHAAPRAQTAPPAKSPARSAAAPPAPAKTSNKSGSGGIVRDVPF
jgi:hypothetical protein